MKNWTKAWWLDLNWENTIKTKVPKSKVEKKKYKVLKPKQIDDWGLKRQGWGFSQQSVLPILPSCHGIILLSLSTIPPRLGGSGCLKETEALLGLEKRVVVMLTERL